MSWLLYFIPNIFSSFYLREFFSAFSASLWLSFFLLFE